MEKTKIVTQMRSTAGHSTGGCNLVFEKLKVCGKVENIHFRKPGISFSAFCRCVIAFCSIG